MSLVMYRKVSKNEILTFNIQAKINSSKLLHFFFPTEYLLLETTSSTRYNSLTKYISLVFPSLNQEEKMATYGNS